MIVLMFWLSRTLEMMQNDMRTSGMRFWYTTGFVQEEELFMDVFDENDEFGIHLHMANECLCLLDVDEFKQNGFGIWMSFCMSFQHEQPACLKPNCMFYFWKLPHVFVMSFVCFANG